MSKQRIFKRLGAMLMVVSMLCATQLTTFAAEDRTKISSIKLRVSSDITTGSTESSVDITTTTSHATISEIEVTNEPMDEWESGDQPKVQVTLSADDGYYFYSISSSKVTLSGDDATYVTSSTQDDKETLVVTIRLASLDGDLTIDETYWSDDTAVATWEPGDGANYYQVRLYRGTTAVTSALTTYNEYYDFSSYITKTGYYTFKVRSIGSSTSKKSDWIESDEWYVDSTLLSYVMANASTSGNTSTTATTGGSWQKDNNGWWFLNSDRTYPISCWRLINNQWYYFNANGYMATGWILTNGTYYYCDAASGAMLTNTTTPDGYIVDANGAWVH